MVTNLKRSKKIRAFCYRMIAMAALLTAICTAVMGREALVDAYYHGPEVFSGSIYNLPEFRAYIAELYNKAMNGYAGIGDDNGYPLTDSHAEEYSAQAKRDFERMLSSLGNDIVYYIRVPGSVGGNGTGTVTEICNVSYPIFSEYDGHLLLPEDVMLCCSWNGEKQSLSFFNRLGDKGAPYQYYAAQYKPNEEAAREIKLVLAVKKDCQQYPFEMMEYTAARYQEIFVTLLVSGIAWLVFGVMGLISGRAARKAKEEFGEWSGKVLLELKLVLVAAAIGVIAFFGLYTFGYDTQTRMWTYDSLWLYFPMGCLVYLYYIDLKQNQARIFLSSLPVKGVCSIAELVGRKPWHRRASVLCISTLIGGIALIVGGIGMILVRINIPYYIYRKMVEWMLAGGIAMILVGGWLIYSYFRQSKLLKDTSAIVNKLEEVTNGRTGAPLVVSKNSLLENAAKDLNELENGIEKAVEQQNRSNKMRVELLTNVSHDLKTPLTSIINYADLLCEEELPETAAGYAASLQDKAYRLKHMVQDVFDLSKATSGNLNVETAVIDLVKLIKQTLADMDERIQDSNLTFRLNISNEPLMIEADGEKLYRVFQNLFVNALQYSLENSRVHIQLLEEDGFAVAKVKNTSRLELNFEPEEIVERFVRADSSRTTEGSGLGLSIVQSFAEACGGQFRVETDADMFTACVRFPLSQKPVIVEPVEFEEGV